MEEEFFSQHFTLEKVSENVYAAIAKDGSGSVANSGFVDLGGKVLVFDTFNTQQASEDLKYIAEKMTKQPVTWVINSHWHGDHIRGNQSFKGSNIISSDTTYSKMKDIHPSRIEKQKDDIEGLSKYIHSLESKDHDGDLSGQISFLKELEKSLPSLELVLPDQTFTDEITFHGTKKHAKLFTMGGGHSECDAMLFIPDEKVIFMGDLLFVNCHPTFFDESNLVNWCDILREVEQFDFDTAIPGHGSIGTKKDITILTEYINEITNLAKENNDVGSIEMPDRYKRWNSPEVFYQDLKLLKES